MDKTASVGLRKRQQISQANRMMFLWVAGVSVIVGVSLVLVVFLVQKIMFGEKVIAEKNKTVSVLQQNLKVVPDLKDNVRVLNTNEALGSTKLKDSDQALQSILDALPAAANSTALASSLQMKLLAGIPGITIEAINVDSTDGGLVTDSSQPVAVDTAASQIGFTFSVSTDASNYSALQQVLQRIEKSIRPFNLTTVSVESQGSRVVMTVSGVSFYEPAQTIQLLNKVVKP